MIKNVVSNYKKYLLLCIIICSLINFSFYLSTFENNWASDDYQYIFGTKLFNLINEQQFYLYETNDKRLNPGYWFIVQFIPPNYKLWHLFLVLIYFFSSIINFFIIHKISNDKKLSFLSSILFSLNFSISLKSLTWGVFFGHILNVFIGLILVLVFISLITQKRLKYSSLILFIILNLINFSITEGAAIYLFINFVILILWKKKLYISRTLIGFYNFLPLLIYLFFSFLDSGKLAPIFQERLDTKKDTYYQKLFNYNDENKIYFYRSTYAPRDFQGYSLRLIENLAGTFNLSLLENNIKSLDKNNLIKSNIKENFLTLAIIFTLSLIIFLFYLARKIRFKKNISEYYFFIALFVTTLLIYNFIYFRKDINLALAFSGSLLLAKILVDLLRYKKKFLFYFLLSIYSFPTIISFIFGFNYYGDFNKAYIQDLSKKYVRNLSVKKNENILLQKDPNFKYFYFYNNFELYKNDLKIYENNELNVFFKRFHLYK